VELASVAAGVSILTPPAGSRKLTDEVLVSVLEPELPDLVPVAVFAVVAAAVVGVGETLEVVAPKH